MQQNFVTWQHFNNASAANVSSSFANPTTTCLFQVLLTRPECYYCYFYHPHRCWDKHCYYYFRSLCVSKRKIGDSTNFPFKRKSCKRKYSIYTLRNNKKDIKFVLELIKMYSRAPVIPPARKRTEFDYNYLSPEDRRRLERPMVWKRRHKVNIENINQWVVSSHLSCLSRKCSIGAWTEASTGGFW